MILIQSLERKIKLYLLMLINCFLSQLFITYKKMMIINILNFFFLVDFKKFFFVPLYLSTSGYNFNTYDIYNVFNF